MKFVHYVYFYVFIFNMLISLTFQSEVALDDNGAIL